MQEIKKYLSARLISILITLIYDAIVIAVYFCIHNFINSTILISVFGFSLFFGGIFLIISKIVNDEYRLLILCIDLLCVLICASSLAIILIYTNEFLSLYFYTFLINYLLFDFIYDWIRYIYVN